jgi:hypothetical protein
MPLVSHSFLSLAHKQFDYLQHDFGFSAEDHVAEGGVQSASVRYDSPKVAITPWWDSRDGAAIGITAKEDTFWIRPASSHEFDVKELAQVLPPEAKRSPPAVSWPEEADKELDAWLAFYADQLRTYAQPLLRGELSLCEDMLIMRYCNSTKGLPQEEYLKIFREEIAALSAEDRKQVDVAIASGSPRQLYFLLDAWVHAGRLRGERFLTTLNDFWLQYLQ